MRSFDAEELVRQLLERLMDSRSSARIDAQIDRAMAGFACAAPAVWTEGAFDKTLILLVQHLHLHAMTPAQQCTPYEAVVEAQRLLTESYSTQSGRGYDAALAGVLADGADAMKAVIAGIFEVFRERRKQLDFNWAIHSAIAPLDWQQRCQVVCALLEAGKDHLPDAVLCSPPAELVDSLIGLIMDRLHMETYLAQFTTRAMSQ